MGDELTRPFSFYRVVARTEGYTRDAEVCVVSRSRTIFLSFQTPNNATIRKIFIAVGRDTFTNFVLRCGSNQ